MGESMSRTLRRCFYEHLTFAEMLVAHERARTNKTSRLEVMNFEFNLECNIVNLIRAIKLGRYQVGAYREFTIYEPKERIIKALPYRDRVVHQWYIHAFIKPYYEVRFIKDTYACIEGRGTHQAVKTLQKYLSSMELKVGTYYILKMDISKFFYHIDHNILLRILNKRIKDKQLLAFTKVLLNDGEGVGIPIGNYTSQYFANIYLNELDQYVKHALRLKYYVRYMDDFIILVKDKERAKLVFGLIKQFLRQELKLELNPKSKYYPSNLGVDFCGFRLWTTHRLVRQRSLKGMQSRLKWWVKLKNKGELKKEHWFLSYQSWLGHVGHADTYNLRLKVNNQLKALGIRVKS